MAYKIGDNVRIIDTNTEIDGDVGTVVDVIRNHPQGITGKRSYVVTNDNDRYILREEFLDAYR